MERKRVNSSRIRAVGYDAKTQDLEVEFSDGRVVVYSRVSGEVHRQFMAALSLAIKPFQNLRSKAECAPQKAA